MKSLMSRRVSACVAPGFVGLAVSAAHAHDINPPPWRGAQYSSFAEFTFPTPANPAPPSPGAFWGDGAGPGAVPFASIGQGFFWEPSFPGWVFAGLGTPDPGIIDIFMPNWIDNEPIKIVQLQVTYQGNPTVPPLVPGGPPAIIDIFSVPPTVGGEVSVSPDIIIDPTNGLFHRTITWEIRPNPDFERIILGVAVDTVITQIVVDTISLPAPGAFALGAIAGIVAFQRRRR